MSIKDNKDYLHLIWQSETTRRQHIVGVLTKNGCYEFSYKYPDVDDAISEGFSPLISFPETNLTYVSSEMFPVFLSRLPDKKRPDIEGILNLYGLENYDAFNLLKASGAKLPIDNLYFIDPILDLDKPFSRDFFVAGSRYYLGCNGTDCCNSFAVTVGSEVALIPEPSNLKDPNAIQVCLNDLLLGYVPRFYSREFSQLIENGSNFHAIVKKIEKRYHNCSECILITVTVDKK